MNFKQNRSQSASNNFYLLTGKMPLNVSSLCLPRPLLRLFLPLLGMQTLWLAGTKSLIVLKQLRPKSLYFITQSFARIVRLMLLKSGWLSIKSSTFCMKVSIWSYISSLVWLGQRHYSKSFSFTWLLISKTSTLLERL